MAKDDVLATEWVRKAAEGGHPSGMDGLAFAYLEGLGVKKDDAKAYEWYRKAANERELSGMYGFAYCLEHGVGVTPNASEAEMWYHRAAKHGSDLAKERISPRSRWDFGLAGLTGSAKQDALDAARDAIRDYHRHVLGGPAGGILNLNKRCPGGDSSGLHLMNVNRAVR